MAAPHPDVLTSRDDALGLSRDVLGGVLPAVATGAARLGG
jgi:hypothetical protein